MSRVVVVKYIGGQQNRPLSQSEYELLLRSALRILSGNDTVSMALRQYVPRGKVGMKPNCVARKLNSTSVALTDALSSLFVEAGFKENNLVVWERSNRELSGAGYQLNATSSGRACLGSDATIVGYSDQFYSFGEVNSLVTRILTEIVDFNINLPILKDHSLAGLSGGLKNMYGAISNPNKYHGNNCNPYCAQVSNLEPLRTKNRLTIMDAVRVQYDGGPGYAPDFFSFFGSIIVSGDPVAADRVGLEILEHLRKTNGLPTLGREDRPVKYLGTAESIGLGVADLKKIDLQVVRVDRNGRETIGDLF
jgi:uncharacterized protein (DUF362 family)